MFFPRYRVRSRVLQDVSERTLSTTVLGQPVPFPIGIAPTGLHVMAHPEAEKATAKGTIDIISRLLYILYSTHVATATSYYL